MKIKGKKKEVHPNSQIPSLGNLIENATCRHFFF